MMFFMACAFSLCYAQAQHAVFGVVSDNNGEKLVGAYITIDDGKSFTTDGNGKFQI